MEDLGKPDLSTLEPLTTDLGKIAVTAIREGDHLVLEAVRSLISSCGGLQTRLTKLLNPKEGATCLWSDLRTFPTHTDIQRLEETDVVKLHRLTPVASLSVACGVARGTLRSMCHTGFTHSSRPDGQGFLRSRVKDEYEYGLVDRIRSLLLQGKLLDYYLAQGVPMSRLQEITNEEMGEYIESLLAQLRS